MKFFIYKENLNFCAENAAQKYAKEIIEALKNTTHEETLDPLEAKVFFTNISNERNYEKFTSSGFGELRPINYLKICQKVVSSKYLELGPHFTFFHRLDNKDYRSALNHKNIVNVPYHNPNFDPLKDFIISPPAIKKVSFNDSLLKRFLLSFKGHWGIRSIQGRDHRWDCLDKISKLNNDHIIIIDSKDGRHDYIDLMSNSLFSLITEGDEPWSYRLSEAICAGSIPVLLEKDWRNLPYSNIINYNNFIIRINYLNPEMAHNAIMNCSLEEISTKIKYMKSISHLFSSRRDQMQSLLDFYEKISR